MLDQILVINPNSSEGMARDIDTAIAPLRFADGPKIECLTLAEGPTRYRNGRRRRHRY